MVETNDIFLIGTGFEKDYNQPLMTDFPNDMISLNRGNPHTFLEKHEYLELNEKDWLYKDDELAEDLQLYFSMINKFNIKTQEDIEEILDFAHKYLKPEIRKIFFILIHYVFFLRELGFYRSKGYKSKGNQLLGYYEKLLKQKNNMIITTNYTSFIEKEHPKKVSNGNEIYTLDNSYLGLKTPSFPLILKLHGGVVFYLKEKDLSAIFTNEDKQFIEYYSFKKERGEFGEHIDKRQGDQVVIPPIKNKDIFFDNPNFKFLEEIWECGEKEIKNVRGGRFFAIGYSFKCEDIKLFELLKKVKDVDVYIILPHEPKDIIKKRIGKIFCNAEKIIWVGMCAKNFVENYPNSMDNFLAIYPHIEIPRINE